MEPLQWTLADRPSDCREEQALRSSLLESLWGSSQEKDAACSVAFMDHYLRQRLWINVHRLKLNTHRDFVSLILFVKRNIAITRQEVIERLTETHTAWLSPASDSADRALEIATRVWLMVSIEDWEATQTLENFIHRSFLKAGRISNVPALPASFNGYNLEKVGGFDIIWTECVQEHLSLVSNQRKKELKVFHLASFLQHHQRNVDCQIYPPGFLEETARTLALLFPASDLACRNWVRTEQRNENLDLEAGLFPPAPRDISEYMFWGPQLLALKEEYDSTEPTTIRQWIRDKRRPNQRYTFWIAVTALVLALVFGLIQSITGIIQAVVTVRSG